MLRLIVLIRLVAIFTQLMSATALLTREDHFVTRWVTFVVGLILSGSAWRGKQKAWAASFVAMAVIFNPIFRFHPGKAGWIALDCAAALLLTVSFFTLKEPESR